MNYKQFQSNLYNTISGSELKNHTVYYGFTIVETTDNVFINGIETVYTNLEEAKEFIQQQLTQEHITQQINQELYEDLSYTIVADIINNYHDVRVTDTLIESYKNLASSKIFTVDPVIKDIKTINKLDTVLEDHYEFILNDDSKILVSEQILQYINNILGNNTDIIEYMRESKDNFFHVLELIKEE